MLLVGARSLDEAEQEALRRSEVTWLTPAQARDPGTVAAAVAGLAREADAVHFHVDLDVYDPSIAPANSYAAPDGLLAGDVQGIVTQTAGQLPIVSATLASYDPTLDPAGRMRYTAIGLAQQLAGCATPGRAAVSGEGRVRGDG